MRDFFARFYFEIIIATVLASVAAVILSSTFPLERPLDGYTTRFIHRLD